MAGLTTRIIDSLTGRPADGLHVEVLRLEANDAMHPLREMVTGPDGTPDRPLVPAREMAKGEYEIRFYVGLYYRENSVVEAEPRFLNVIAVRVGIADPDADYHVPLVMSPWSYTVHRG